MADIAFLATSTFSGATPVVVSAKDLADSSVVSNATALDSAQTLEFTSSAAANMTGAFVCLKMASDASGQSVTVKLQTFSGSWGDVAGATKTLTYQAIVGATATGAGAKTAARAWVYFEFTTPAAITTAGSTWRLNVVSTNSSASWRRSATSSVAFLHGVVLDTTTTYASGDNIFQKQNTTITIDQTFTATSYMQGVDSMLSSLTPAASYTITMTNLYPSKSSGIVVGSSGTPVPVAQQQTWNVTNIYDTYVFDGLFDWKNTFYGAKPTNFRTTLSANANSGQKVIITSTDMSASWVAGDTIYVAGGNSAGGTTMFESKVIDTIVGTTVTFTANLTVTHYAGWGVFDYTREHAGCGIRLTEFWQKTSPSGSGMGMNATAVFSGISLSNSGDGIFISGLHSSASVDTTLVTPWIFDHIFYEQTATSGAPLSVSCGNLVFPSTLTITEIHSYTRTTGSTISTNAAGATISHLYFGGSASFGCLSVVSTGAASTVTTCNLASAAASIGQANSSWSLIGCAVSGVKTWYGGQGMYITQAVSCTFTSCTVDKGQITGITLNTILDTYFINCSFGQDATNTKDFGFGNVAASGFITQAVARNCLFSSTGAVLNDTLGTYALVGSYFKADTYNQTTNDHRSWWNYGKLQSTGTSLSDTTVHTAGGLAIRFEPQSSTTQHKWEFTIPTGSISTKTMMIGVWVKINSATYYAGTHQMPRLYVDYDNGTTAYTQAAQTTDWQFLPLPFTPATTYGLITVKITGYTDATTTNAYFYADDWVTIFPANSPLNTQTLDLWANALPVTPPIATVLSATDVWALATSTMTGAGTVGKLVTKLLSVAKFLALR